MIVVAGYGPQEDYQCQDDWEKVVVVLVEEETSERRGLETV